MRNGSKTFGPSENTCFTDPWPPFEHMPGRKSQTE